jgi:3-hydroxybutyryl-CoA dehydrogenase
LAAGTSHPKRFIGIHSFNPVPLMPPVELIHGLLTSETTQSGAASFVGVLGKTAIDTKDAPGFAVNRILCPTINEAIFALQEGVPSAADIDQGMELGYSHPIGPLALADLVGLDIGWTPRTNRIGRYAFRNTSLAAGLIHRKALLSVGMRNHP